MPRKTKAEAMKTRAGILRAAERAFYEKGVVSTSLQEIAQRAGVTRGAVYWHFKDKAELLHELAQDEFRPNEELMDRLVQSEQEDPLGSMLRASLEGMQAMTQDTRRRRIMTILTRRCEYIGEMQPLLAHNQKCRELLIARLISLFEQARRKGQLASVWSPLVAAQALQSLLYGFVETEMEYPRPSAKRGRERTQALTTFFKALGARSDF